MSVGTKKTFPGNSECFRFIFENAQIGIGIFDIEAERHFSNVNQQIATELLQSSGAKVTVANHGAEAVKILTNRDQPPFDMVRVDLQMPEMDGLTATRLLRAEPDLQRLPIIAMTAHAMDEEVHRCLQAGMNDHIAEPIDPNTLFATLMRWMSLRERGVSDVPTAQPTVKDELAPPEVEGVDVSGGLRRVYGNVRLYRDLLAQFASKQASAGMQIAAALKNGDRSLAEQRAHSLKGVAGNLGIDAIFRSAGKLERAIRDSHADVEVLIRELSSLLDRQVQVIGQRLTVALPLNQRSNTQTTSSRSAIVAAIDELRALLETNDADAPRAYLTLAENLKGIVDAAPLEALGAAVKQFDFDAALSQLEEITKESRPLGRNDESCE